MLKYLFSLILVTCFLGTVAQEAGDTIHKPVVYPENYTAQLNVVYTKVNGWEGKMDLYLSSKSNKPTPVIINIHGGGWNHGVKEGQGGFNSFFKAGFAVANIEYRLTGQATAPAAIEDTRCALIYLINNAKSLNIDPDKIIFMGASSGGHLALMGGLLGNDPVFDNNCKHTVKVKIAAIIDKYGIADVWDWGYGKNITSKSATNWLGDKKMDSVFAASVSPVTYVSRNSPPTLIIHGDADPTVPYQQSEMLYAKFQKAGVKSEFITVSGGLHGKFDKEKNDELNTRIMKFISEVLQSPQIAL